MNWISNKRETIIPLVGFLIGGLVKHGVVTWMVITTHLKLNSTTP